MLIYLVLLSGAVFAQDQPPKATRNFWRASLAAFVTANALDIHSSWGKQELNPVLAAPNARFGGQGALMKLGFVGAVTGLELLVTRHRPSAKVYRVLGFVNFGAAAVVGGTAAHNYTVATSTK